MHELSTRVARSVEISKHRGLFENDGLWRKRARACIEATASLVCCTDAKFSWFGGVSELLGEIGSFEKIREISLAGTDQLFVMRWTCLSLVAIRPILDVKSDAPQFVGMMIEVFAGHDSGNNDALATARKIDETLKKASDCLSQLCEALPNTEDLTEEVKEILRDHESEISELEQINLEADRLKWADYCVSDTQLVLDNISYKITSQFPGVLDEFDFHCLAPIPFSRLAELSRDPLALHFLRPRQTLKSMCSPAITLRNILEPNELQRNTDADAYKKHLKNLKNSSFSSWGGNEMQRHLLHLQDLRDAAGLGFTVELFFLALSQLLSTSSSRESRHSALYTGTFRSITSDWSKHKDSLGTQKLLLNIAISRRWEFNDVYPAYIVEEFLVLLRNIFEGQAGSHIDEAIVNLAAPILPSRGGVTFEDRLLKVITGVRAPPQ